MDHALPVLRQIRIASPCPTSWDSMSGNDRVRFCSECKLHVYNLAAMTAGEIEQLIKRTEGRLCGWIHRRADGTVMTRDCPVGLQKARRRVLALMGQVAASCVIAGGALTALATGVNQDEGTGRLATREPFRTLRRWAGAINPPAPVRHDLGMLMLRDPSAE